VCILREYLPKGNCAFYAIPATTSSIPMVLAYLVVLINNPLFFSGKILSFFREKNLFFREKSSLFFEKKPLFSRKKKTPSFEKKTSFFEKKKNSLQFFFFCQQDEASIIYVDI